MSITGTLEATSRGMEIGIDLTADLGGVHVTCLGPQFLLSYQQAKFLVAFLSAAIMLNEAEEKRNEAQEGGYLAENWRCRSP